MAVAKNLLQVLQHPLVLRALDRSQPIEEIIEDAYGKWVQHVYDLYRKRHPAPAYNVRPDGARVYQATDYDFLTHAIVLSKRSTVINIPWHENLRPGSSSSDRRVVADENRHGQLLRVVSHKGSHSFSVLIMDYMTTKGKPGREKVGAPTNFAVIDDSGNLYNDWSGFDWNETPEEARFIKDNGLEAFRGVIKFRYAVTPALAASFYSQKYLVPAIIEGARRLDEVNHHKELVQELRDQGIKLPPPPDDEKVIYLKESAKKSMKVENLEAKVLLPDGVFKGKYPLYGIEPFQKGKTPKLKRYTGMPVTLKGKQEILRYCLWHLKKLAHKYGPMIRLPTRTIELAFFLYGRNEDGTEIKPTWPVPEWTRDFKEKPRGKKWNRLDLQNVQLLYRIRNSTVYHRARTMPVYLDRAA